MVKIMGKTVKLELWDTNIEFLSSSLITSNDD